MVQTQTASTRTAGRRRAALAASALLASMIATVAWPTAAGAADPWIIATSVAGDGPYALTVSGTVPQNCARNGSSVVVDLEPGNAQQSIAANGGPFSVSFGDLAAAGPYTVSVTVDDPPGGCQLPEDVAVLGPLVWTDDDVDTEVTVSTGYTDAVAAVGNGTVTYALAGGTLPAGISLDSGTGALTGTPSTIGTSTFTVRATDAAALTITAPLQITVVAAVIETSLAWTDTSLPGGAVGTGYSDGVAAAGTGTITYAHTAGALPPGLVLAPATGALSGTPTTAGTYTFTLQATNGTDTVTTTPSVAVASIAVQPSPVVVNPARPSPAPAPTPMPAPTPTPAPAPAPVAVPAPVAPAGSGPVVVGAVRSQPAAAVQPSAVNRELARTGTTTLPLTLFGFGLVLVGAAAAATGRRRAQRFLG